MLVLLGVITAQGAKDPSSCKNHPGRGLHIRGLEDYITPYEIGYPKLAAVELLKTFSIKPELPLRFSYIRAKASASQANNRITPIRGPWLVKIHIKFREVQRRAVSRSG